MSRPRGYAPWDPKPDTLALLDNVGEVLDEYKDFLPLTVRQVFYRLVGQYSYDKTEQAYARLCEHLVRARRAGMIDFTAIRDDGTAGGAPQVFDDVGGFWAAVRDDLEHYSRNRLAGQPIAIELWCEAAGMVPQLQRVAYPFSVPVYSTGGFSSVTVTKEIADRALTRNVPTVFLHVGDFDPSGQSIFEAMGNDAREFVKQLTLDTPAGDALREQLGVEFNEAADFDPIRVALTEEQVQEHDLPTAPPKRSDTRSKNWGSETCQLEAMPPEVLATTVREAIEDRIDTVRFREEVGRERADRERIETALTAAEKGE